MALFIFLCCLIPTVIFAILLLMVDRKYSGLQKENDALHKEIAGMYRANSERLAIKVDFEPEYFYKDQTGYSRMIAEKAAHALMNTMIGHVREKLMTHFIKCMAERKPFWENDICTLRSSVYVNVPVYRLDYDLIQIGRDLA